MAQSQYEGGGLGGGSGDAFDVAPPSLHSFTAAPVCGALCGALLGWLVGVAADLAINYMANNTPQGPVGGGGGDGLPGPPDNTATQAPYNHD